MVEDTIGGYATVTRRSLEVLMALIEKLPADARPRARELARQELFAPTDLKKMFAERFSFDGISEARKLLGQELTGERKADALVNDVFILVYWRGNQFHQRHVDIDDAKVMAERLRELPVDLQDQTAARIREAMLTVFQPRDLDSVAQLLKIDQR